MRYPAYPSYKASGVEWLGDVPEHWATKRVKYAATINDETLGEDTDPSLLFDYVDIGGVDAKAGIVEWEATSFEDAPSRARRVARDGDTIVSTVRTYLRAIAPIKVHQQRVIVSTGFAVVRPKLVDPGFLSYALRESRFVETVVSRSVGVSYPAVNASDVADIVVPLPTSVEQRGIAEYLDGATTKLDALMAKKQALIEKLKERRAALISRAVSRGLPPDAARSAGLDPYPRFKSTGVDWLGEVPQHWRVKALKWESAVLRGASPRPIDDPVYFDDAGEYAWVRISDVTATGMYLTGTAQRLSELGTALSVRLQPGAFFLSIAGSVGKPCITAISCCIHDGFVYLPHWGGDVRFLYYIFASGEPYKGLGKLGTQLNLNTDTVGSIVVGLPPIAEQRAIADYLDRETAKIDAMVAKVEQAIERLQEYRAALITAAVTGRIDVRAVAAENRPRQGTVGARRLDG